MGSSQLEKWSHLVCRTILIGSGCQFPGKDQFEVGVTVVHVSLD